jgi:HEPN domain-containing protein
MKNRKHAIAWLEKAWHDLSGAMILYESEHYGDVICAAIQQALEKSMKSLLAAEDRKIPKTHNLLFLYDEIEPPFRLDEEEIDLLIRIAQCYLSERYPPLDRTIPDRYLCGEMLDLAERFFHAIRESLEIPMAIIE